VILVAANPRRCCRHDPGSADVAAAHREAIRLVRKHREAIERVAVALIARRKSCSAISRHSVPH